MTESTTQAEIQLIIFEDVHLDVVRLSDGWDSAEYQKYASVLYLSPADLKRLGVKSGAHVRLTAKGVHITLQAKPEKRCTEGMGWLPASPYSNYLAVYDPAVTQLPLPKVMGASISPTEDEVTSVSQILQRAGNA